MGDKCPDSSRDCPLEPRVKRLEEENQKQFDRLREVEQLVSTQIAHYEEIDKKLDRLLEWQEKQRDRMVKIESIDGLEKRVTDLESKPGKRWDGIIDKAIWAVLAAVIAFFLGRVGL